MLAHAMSALICNRSVARSRIYDAMRIGMPPRTDEINAKIDVVVQDDRNFPRSDKIRDKTPQRDIKKKSADQEPMDNRVMEKSSRRVHVRSRKMQQVVFHKHHDVQR